MEKKKLISVIIAFMMTLTVCFYAFCPVACAITDKQGSIVIHVSDSKTSEFLQGATFRLYFFAAAYEKEDGVGYNYVVPYDGCNMEIGNLQDAYLPVHLTHFALSNNLEYKSETSDQNGTLVFDNLTAGIYLIVPEKNIPDYYMPSPFVINIPIYDKKNNVWVYDINATPKIQMRQINDSQGTTYISVKKLWENTSEHPDSITVSLLRDFREVETVTLNERNNWQHRWDNLSKNYIWSVVESKVPDGYRVSYETSQNTVTIVNKGTSDENVPTTSVTPSITPSEKPTVPTKPNQPTTKPEELIDTGQLNWPVPVFSVAGMILFSIGWAMLNLGKKDEEAI